MDISDYEGLDSIKQAYLDMDKELELVPQEAYMRYLMQPMRLGCCITRTFLMSMAGKSPLPGMNSCTVRGYPGGRPSAFLLWIQRYLGPAGSMECHCCRPGGF